MRNSLKALLALCLALGLIGVGLATGLGEPAAEAQEKKVKKSAEKPKRDVALAFPGVVVPAHLVRVGPRVGGHVQQVLIDEGTRVKAGQVLVRLDRTEYELEYNRSLAEADRARALLAEEESRGLQGEEEIKQAEAAVQEAAAHVAQARAEVARLQALVKAAAATAEAVSERQAHVLVNQAKVRQAEAKLMAVQRSPQKQRVAAAKAAVAVAEAQRDLAKFRLDGTEVRAPISGTILAMHVQAGQTVRPDAVMNGRPMSLCEIADLSQLEAVIDVPESTVHQVRLKQKCEIRVPAVPGAAYQGEVSRVSPVVSARTRTVAVRVRIEAPPGDRNLRPGMFAQLRLLSKD